MTPFGFRILARSGVSFSGMSIPVVTLIPVTLLHTDGVLFEIDAVAISSNPMPLGSEKQYPHRGKLEGGGTTARE